MPKILLINPWIYDFAAYDLWIKPWGLLKISNILKKHGFDVYHVDALDRHHPLVDAPVRDKPDGTGKYISCEVEKPMILSGIPRKYKRYGLEMDRFIEALPDKEIDHILVTSVMTYWYQGVFEAIKILKKRYPGAQIILGGSYATLCYQHALNLSGADVVVKNKDISRLSSYLGVDVDLSFKTVLDEEIDYSWYGDSCKYAVLRLSLGCPFDCTYCAQKCLNPGYMQKDMPDALDEIKRLYGRGIKIFAFYDDALLYDMPYIERYLENILSSGIKAGFYTPNGVHARFMTEKIALLMKKAGFIDPILSLETVKDGGLWHKKVTGKEFEDAVRALNKAGYGPGEYTSYLLLGAPGSSMDDVREAIDYSVSLGARVSLSEYTPVPGTSMAEQFPESVFEEPLLQNNSVFPTLDISEWKDLNELKQYARRLNKDLM